MCFVPAKFHEKLATVLQPALGERMDMVHLSGKTSRNAGLRVLRGPFHLFS